MRFTNNFWQMGGASVSNSGEHLCSLDSKAGPGTPDPRRVCGRIVEHGPKKRKREQAKQENSKQQKQQQKPRTRHTHTHTHTHTQHSTQTKIQQQEQQATNNQQPATNNNTKTTKKNNRHVIVTIVDQSVQKKNMRDLFDSFFQQASILTC